MRACIFLNSTNGGCARKNEALIWLVKDRFTGNVEPCTHQAFNTVQCPQQNTKLVYIHTLKKILLGNLLVNNKWKTIFSKVFFWKFELVFHARVFYHLSQLWGSAEKDLYFSFLFVCNFLENLKKENDVNQKHVHNPVIDDFCECRIYFYTYSVVLFASNG